jgi:hypothetical protein
MIQKSAVLRRVLGRPSEGEPQSAKRFFERIMRKKSNSENSSPRREPDIVAGLREAYVYDDTVELAGLRPRHLRGRLTETKDPAHKPNGSIVLTVGCRSQIRQI